MKGRGVRGSSVEGSRSSCSLNPIGFPGVFSSAHSRIPEASRERARASHQLQNKSQPHRRIATRHHEKRWPLTARNRGATMEEEVEEACSHLLEGIPTRTSRSPQRPTHLPRANIRHRRASTCPISSGLPPRRPRRNSVRPVEESTTRNRLSRYGSLDFAVIQH
jgi:hypothetical protein